MSRALLILALLLSSCSLLPMQRSAQGQLAHFQLQSLPAGFVNESRLYRWTVGNTNRLLQLEGQTEQVSLAAVSEQGLTLFTLDGSDVTHLQQSKSPLAHGVNPRQVFRLLQMATWPEDQLADLQQDGWQIQQHGEVREVSYQGTLLYRIEIHGSESMVYDAISQQPASSFELLSTDAL